MLERFFGLSQHNTTVRTEVLAGLTTFLTMSYIIFVQPAVLSGRMFGISTGMDFDSVTTATCLAAALATLIMGLYARYPIGQAPGMGENFVFVFNLLPAAAALIAAEVAAGTMAADSTSPWQIGLGVVFIAGVLFLLLSLLGVREKLIEAISPSMRNGIAIGIGLFIAFIGLQGTGLVVADPATGVKLNPNFASPDLVVFFFGLLVTAGLHALRVRGSIVWGILAATLLSVLLWIGLPYLLRDVSFLRKELSHRASGAGVDLSVETGWYGRPGSEPLEITVTPVVPVSYDRTLTVELITIKQLAGRPKAVVKIPAGSEPVHASVPAPELADWQTHGAENYRVHVTEDGETLQTLSGPWTPVPTLPKLIAESKLLTQFSPAKRIVSRPPSVAPTLLKMDLVRALSWSMVPFILIFLFMDLFDTLGTLLGVSEQAGLIKDNKLPRANRALISDAVGTVAGAAMGTSTVTSFIESAAGVEQGGRTGLTAVTISMLFLLALFFSPVIAMVGSYPPITAPALVVVGSMMIRNVTKIDWSNYAESMPTYLIIIGIPMTYSVSDGLALGFIAYPVIKLIAGQGRDVKWLMYVMALVLVAYFVFVRMGVG